MTHTSVHAFEAAAIDGGTVDLSRWKGRALLIVNTASACGYTPQFAGLEALAQTYGKQGLTVIGFPSNEFGAQDPGPNGQIADFCRKNYGVSFPMMAKVEVNGSAAHPLWQWLRAQAPGSSKDGRIEWNFTKFLVGRDGVTVTRFEPARTPESLKGDIESTLAKA